jgi:perosamine synthetase
MRIPLSNINLSDLEKGYVNDALNTGWISGTGNYVTRFEEALARQVQRKHAIAVSNGTVALELALKALDIRPGDEVIVPALTFVAPAAAVRNVGATPVLVDIDPISWTISPLAVAQHMSSATKAIIAVDLLGHPADYDALLSVAPHIPVIEDAAQAHGALYKGRPVGSLGTISTFSFHSNKGITCGEGGAALTNNHYLAERMRLIANHGMTSAQPYYHEVVGSNYRMTNLAAAIGLGQVERWEELTSARQQVAETYDRLLQPINQEFTKVRRRTVSSWATESCWLYCIDVPEREFILGSLRSVGIDARALWTALPNLPLYKNNARGLCSTARSRAASCIWLPTWAGMHEDRVEDVVSELSMILDVVLT